MKNKLLTHICIGIVSAVFSLSSYARTVIAIDAGHGGKDPGAIGRNLGIKEKDVTLSIARELKSLLDADPNFRAVMTRNGDYFIQLPNRTEIARKGKANYLISIHADSSPSGDSLKGSSVWVLSNRRANDELGKWLEDREKQSELLGGAGSVLSNANERYLNQTVLDLQFSHSQRSGYELGKSVLSKLANVAPLAKKNPQHASLSVLRSPDIPSILVETGFLSNASEEQKLANAGYRRQVARAIYQGIVAYASQNARYTTPKTVYKEEKNTKPVEVKTETKKVVDEPKKATTKSDNKLTEQAKKAETVTTKETAKKETVKKSEAKPENVKKAELSKAESKTAKASDPKLKTKDSDKSTATDKTKTDKVKTVNPNATYHVVAQDETLYSIARMYKTTPEKLSQLNNIKDNKIIVGKKLKLK